MDHQRYADEEADELQEHGGLGEVQAQGDEGIEGGGFGGADGHLTAEQLGEGIDPGAQREGEIAHRGAAETVDQGRDLLGAGSGVSHRVGHGGNNGGGVNDGEGFRRGLGLFGEEVDRPGIGTDFEQLGDLQPVQAFSQREQIEIKNLQRLPRGGLGGGGFGQFFHFRLQKGSQMTALGQERGHQDRGIQGLAAGSERRGKLGEVGDGPGLKDGGHRAGFGTDQIPRHGGAIFLGNEDGNDRLVGGGQGGLAQVEDLFELGIVAAPRCQFGPAALVVGDGVGEQRGVGVAHLRGGGEDELGGADAITTDEPQAFIDDRARILRGLFEQQGINGLDVGGDDPAEEEHRESDPDEAGDGQVEKRTPAGEWSVEFAVSHAWKQAPFAVPLQRVRRDVPGEQGGRFGYCCGDSPRTVFNVNCLRGKTGEKRGVISL